MTALDRRAIDKCHLVLGISYAQTWGLVIQKGKPELQQQPKMELARLLNALNRFSGFMEKSMPPEDWKESTEFMDDMAFFFEKFFTSDAQKQHEIKQFMNQI